MKVFFLTALSILKRELFWIRFFQVPINWIIQLIDIFWLTSLGHPIRGLLRGSFKKYLMCFLMLVVFLELFCCFSFSLSSTMKSHMKWTLQQLCICRKRGAQQVFRSSIFYTLSYRECIPYLGSLDANWIGKVHNFSTIQDRKCWSNLMWCFSLEKYTFLKELWIFCWQDLNLKD